MRGVISSHLHGWCAGVIIIAQLPCAVVGQESQVTALSVERLVLDLELSSIRWAFLRPDRTLVFADELSRTVYTRSRAGVVSELGRHGDGPGEYRFPSAGYSKGDSIVIHEIGLGRREAINLRTNIGTSRRFVDSLVGMDCRVVLLIVDQGVCQTTTKGTLGTGSNILTSHWFRLTSAGHELKAIQVAYDTSYVARLVHKRGVLYVPRPYLWASRTGLTSTGRFGAVLQQTQVGSAAEVSVTIWDIISGQSRTITRAELAIEVPPSAGKGLASEAVAELGRRIPQVATQKRDFETGLLRGWALATMAPPFAAVFASDDHCLWLQRTDVGWPARRGTVVFDRWTFDGRKIPSVSMKSGLKVISVECEVAVAVDRDEHDVPQLLMLRAR